MIFKKILPDNRLNRYIRYFWILQSDVAELSSEKFRIFSDGCPGLIFHDGGSHFIGDDKIHLTNLSIYGQTTKSTYNISYGKYTTIGVYFQPNAIKSIFGIDAHELTDNTIDIRLLGVTKENLTERLLDTSSNISRISILSNFFLSQIERTQINERSDLLDAIFTIQKSNGGKSVQEIVKNLNVSKRTIERSFNQSVGISPKLFSRITRFQSTLDHLRNADSYNLSELCFKYNYSDQSHFIRDFKEFSGVLPHNYRKDVLEIVENFPLSLK